MNGPRVQDVRKELRTLIDCSEDKWPGRRAFLALEGLPHYRAADPNAMLNIPLDRAARNILRAAIKAAEDRAKPVIVP